MPKRNLIWGLLMGLVGVANIGNILTSINSKEWWLVVVYSLVEAVIVWGSVDYLMEFNEDRLDYKDFVSTEFPVMDEEE